MSNLLQKGDKLEIVNTNSIVEVTKATDAFAHLSDGNKVKQQPIAGEYKEYIPRSQRTGLWGIGNDCTARYYRLLTPERIAEKQRIAEEKRAAKEREMEEKARQIIHKIQLDGVPKNAVDAIYKILFP